MNEENIVVDGSMMVAKEVAEILNQYPMCDLVIDKNALLILDHTGAYILKKIIF
jgi:hypothetical protein